MGIGVGIEMGSAAVALPEPADPVASSKARFGSQQIERLHTSPHCLLYGFATRFRPGRAGS